MDEKAQDLFIVVPESGEISVANGVTKSHYVFQKSNVRESIEL